MNLISMVIINLQLRLNNVLGGIIWSESGNHGNQWNIAQVTLQNIQINTPTYQVSSKNILSLNILIQLTCFEKEFLRQKGKLVKISSVKITGIKI